MLAQNSPRHHFSYPLPHCFCRRCLQFSYEDVVFLKKNCWVNTRVCIQKPRTPEIFLCQSDTKVKSYKSVLVVSYDQGHGKHVAFPIGCMIITPLMINMHPLKMQLTSLGDVDVLAWRQPRLPICRCLFSI